MPRPVRVAARMGVFSGRASRLAIVLIIVAGAVAARAENPQKDRQDAVDAFFESGPLPRLHINVDPKELQSLNNNPKAPVRGQVRETSPGQADCLYCDVA